MGYLISAFATTVIEDFLPLTRLPQSIGYRVLRPHSAAINLIEFYRPGLPPTYPFTEPLPSVDVPLELPERALEGLVDSLRRRQMSNGFKRSYINAARQISDLLASQVFALIADDDELDFTCQASSGSLGRVDAVCGDVSITYTPGSLSVQALQRDEDLNEQFEATNLVALASEVPGVSLVPGFARIPHELHSVAAREFTTFTGEPASLIGLGDFDAEVTLAAFDVVVQR